MFKLKSARLIAGAAALAFVAVGCAEEPPPPAPAQLDFDSAATGNVQIDVEVPEDTSDPENPIPGYTLPVIVPLNGTASGTWVHGGSGAFSVDLGFDEGSFELVVPNVATINIGYSAAQTQPATGTFDPATGLGGFDTAVTMTVLSIDLLGGPVAPPCDLVFELELSGQIDPGTGILDVTQDSFSVVPPGEADCAGLGGIMGQLLGGPLNSVDLSFEVGTI